MAACVRSLAQDRQTCDCLPEVGDQKCLRLQMLARLRLPGNGWRDHDISPMAILMEKICGSKRDETKQCCLCALQTPCRIIDRSHCRLALHYATLVSQKFHVELFQVKLILHFQSRSCSAWTCSIFWSEPFKQFWAKMSATFAKNHSFLSQPTSRCTCRHARKCPRLESETWGLKHFRVSHGIPKSNWIQLDPIGLSVIFRHYPPIIPII